MEAAHGFAAGEIRSSVNIRFRNVDELDALRAGLPPEMAGMSHRGRR